MKNELKMLYGEMHVDISKYAGNNQFLTTKLFNKSLTEIIHVGESLEKQGLPIVYALQHTDWHNYPLLSGSYRAFNVQQAKKYISKVQNNLKKRGIKFILSKETTVLLIKCLLVSLQKPQK